MKKTKQNYKTQHLQVDKKEMKELDKILTKLYGRQSLSRWVRSAVRGAIQEYTNFGRVRLYE